MMLLTWSRKWDQCCWGWWESNRKYSLRLGRKCVSFKGFWILETPMWLFSSRKWTGYLGASEWPAATSQILTAFPILLTTPPPLMSVSSAHTPWKTQSSERLCQPKSINTAASTSPSPKPIRKTWTRIFFWTFTSTNPCFWASGRTQTRCSAKVGRASKPEWPQMLVLAWPHPSQNA